MLKTYTAVVKQDEGAWIGWIEELPGVNCQEDTHEQLLTSLRITLAEAIEFNRTETRNAAGHGYEELSPPIHEGIQTESCLSPEATPVAMLPPLRQQHRG